jgi:hypothetical protein
MGASFSLVYAAFNMAVHQNEKALTWLNSNLYAMMDQSLTGRVWVIAL